MIATKDPGIANRCRVMRLHGISRDAFDRYTSSKASWYYEVVAPGYKYNMTDLVASLGIHQLRKANAFRARRAGLAARYNEAFEGLPMGLPQDARAGDLHAWHLYVVRLTDAAAIPRDRFIERMAEERIGCSVHFIPLHLHPYWRDRYRLKPEDFPRALDAYRRAVSLPLYTRMSWADQDRVIAAVRSLVA
jgi:dTDP-4-amino-4,6-dideoxygalactose transaminase